MRCVALALKVRVERSTSRRGLHMRVSTYLILGSGCSRASARVVDKSPVKPTYAKGEAYEVSLEVPPGHYAVLVDMRRNPRKRVKGDIVVYDWSGRVLFRAVYRKLKIRVVECSAERGLAEELVKCVYTLLKLPVKRYGVSRCEVRGGGRPEEVRVLHIRQEQARAGQGTHEGPRRP